jgi:AraC-like DNA-binding protein
MPEIVGSSRATAFLEQCKEAGALFSSNADYITSTTGLLNCLRAVPEARSHVDRVIVASALLHVSSLPLRQRSDVSVMELNCLQHRMRRRDRTGLVIRLVVSRSRDQNLTLATVAATLGVTDPYLSRAMKADTGLTFATLLHTARVFDAVMALGTTDLPIKQIAADVGYRRPNEMDRAFGAWCHLAPRDFRAVARSELASTITVGLSAGKETQQHLVRFPPQRRLNYGTAAGKVKHVTRPE